MSIAIFRFLNEPFNESVLQQLRNSRDNYLLTKRHYEDLLEYRCADETPRNYIIRRMTEARMVPNEKADINCGPIKKFDELVGQGVPEFEAVKEAWPI